MKVINCGIVIYLITEHHIARIEYQHDEAGKPIAWIYYDNELGEGIQAENGMTMRHAFWVAKSTIKWQEHLERI